MYLFESKFYAFPISTPDLPPKDLLEPTERRELTDFLLLAELSDRNELSKFVWFLSILFFYVLCYFTLLLLFFIDNDFSFDRAFLGILIDFFDRDFDLFLLIWSWYLGYNISC